MEERKNLLTFTHDGVDTKIEFDDKCSLDILYKSANFIAGYFLLYVIKSDEDVVFKSFVVNEFIEGLRAMALDAIVNNGDETIGDVN